MLPNFKIQVKEDLLRNFTSKTEGRGVQGRGRGQRAGGGEMTQTMYAHMNIRIKKKN
jgi:hypothetical protein